MMPETYYPNLTLARPQEVVELLAQQSGEGIRLDAGMLDKQRASRQLKLFRGYLALGLAQQLGIDGARQWLSQGGSAIALETLSIPSQEDDRALLAVWFERALNAQAPRDQVMNLYNAFGSLPAGYAGVEASLKRATDEAQAAQFMQAVQAIRYDEGDLADKASPPLAADYSGIEPDRLLHSLAQLARA